MSLMLNTLIKPLNGLEIRTLHCKPLPIFQITSDAKPMLANPRTNLADMVHSS